MVIYIWQHNFEIRIEILNLSNIFNSYFGHCKFAKIIITFQLYLLHYHITSLISRTHVRENNCRVGIPSSSLNYGFLNTKITIPTVCTV